MDAMVRTLGTAEHPIRTRLIEATDQAFVEQAFEAFLETLREAATPSVVDRATTGRRRLSIHADKTTPDSPLQAT